ncbi:hypothetical protein BOX15_Mlig002305g1 [Macrostomum lignano]|uniref:Phospholipase A2-like central domain-containing protein n=1 Tax=Macrostomum lignano TaxID=282301 RepID=A0A267F2K8_9PLAT|nr:hypothetical protein BOX15_Mlig002305g1 [Macrostomum lignano]
MEQIAAMVLLVLLNSCQFSPAIPASPSRSNSKLQEKKYADPNSNETASVFIIPGTKWCGKGNVATSYENLGSEYETDKCCRDHDTCPHSITALQTRYGLKNPFLTTLSDCECDVKFYFCLKQAAQMSATASLPSKCSSRHFECPASSWSAGRCARAGTSCSAPARVV